MTRTAFLAALEQLLAPLPEAERKDALSYYEDYLDAAGPENEARAIAELGSPEEVARKILDEQTPAGSLLGLDSDTFYIYHVAAVMVDNLRRLLLGINLSDKAIMDFDFPGVGFPV